LAFDQAIVELSITSPTPCRGRFSRGDHRERAGKDWRRGACRAVCYVEEDVEIGRNAVDAQFVTIYRRKAKKIGDGDDFSSAKANAVGDVS